ncbi:MAG: hypothetical protein CVV39_08615 [Planctomycetes bacterium HGW-Planctomycetes-1]|nr:MAG: hypothetical protein CVV39_08615 [Planctomycetes bacterium HGW-Planctomycetes-1]
MKVKSRTMKKYHLILVLLTFLFVGFISVDAKASFTVATFADPSNNSSDPLFTVDFTSLTLTGGWSDAKTDLTLQVPHSGNTFSNAWFTTNGPITMTQILPSLPYYNAGAGQIDFYKDGTSTNPLLVINFDSGFVSPYGFGAVFIASNITITGSEITGSLSQEQFSFSFSNTAPLSNGHNGFTATAAFTSSAVPEPATIALLTIGALALLKRKNGK